ncbi:MAG TPA: CAP domain-containing protein, partial [Acidimicrobiales bacterium]|nr:CAP domain-containing protein [Acidimicrobiales bacterium]
MRQTAVLLAGLIIGGLLLAPAATAMPCGVVVTCAEPEPGPETPPPTVAPTTTSTTVRELTPAEAAARLLTLLNGERAAAGLAPFTMRADVTEIAVGWTSAMADSAHLAHNDAYFTRETRTRLGARLLGENVAYDGSIDAAHRALMASPPHRANILDGRFTVIGIGAEQRDRTWWVTEDFVQPVAAAPAPASTPATVTAAPATARTAASTPTTSGAPVAPAVEDEAPAGAVLSASSAAPEVVAGPTIATTNGPSSTSTTRSPMLVALAAVALLVAYAVSWASASAR